VAHGICLYVDANPISNSDSPALYGAESCEYYTQICKKTDDFYACNVAKNVCPIFPTGKPNGWFQCVRQCLQEELHRRVSVPPSCSATDNAFTDHTTCFSACAINSSNPGMPSGYPARP